MVTATFGFIAAARAVDKVLAKARQQSTTEKLNLTRNE
jgi:tRNA A37 threonylcarbamoyladenosine dehydratase